MSEKYEEFLNWCEGKWTQEHKMQKLLSKLSNDDIDFLTEQYEACLKADMVDLLEELKVEVEQQMPMIDICDYAITSCVSRHEVASIIQRKIDKMKGNQNESTTTN